MKKLLAITLTVVFVLGIVAGCNEPAGTTDPTPTAAPQGGAAATPAPQTQTQAPATTDPEPSATGGKVYRTYMTDDCPILNGHDSVESSLSTPHSYCSSPLFRAVASTEEGGLGYEYIGDLAAELPIQIDDYNWQIKIREGATWHNGDPINADTFIYSYKMQLDPILANQMADFIADYGVKIVNASEYMLQGTANTVAWEDVGIKKIDDYTIQITTIEINAQSDVCYHFTDRSTYPVYEPYYEAGMSADRTSTTYGTTLETWMGCGPYFFTTWEYDNMHVYTKNPDHWLADLFKYDTVEIRIVPEMNARVELWEQGLLDDLSPDSNTIETYIDDPRLVSYPSISVDHIDVNCKNPVNPISGSINYRKALYHAFDREVIAYDLFGYQEPSGTYVNGMAGSTSETGELYRESSYGQAVTAMVESWGPYGYNPEMALDYFNKACEEMGVGTDEVINIIFATGEDSTWKAVGEYIQQEFPKIFENRMTVEIVTYAGMSATDFKATGDDKWDLSPNSWARGASRTTPHTCFYYYLTSYGTAPNNFFDEEFEAQYAVCDATAADPNKTYEDLLAETQKLEEIYLEKVIHIPIYQNVNYQMFSDRLVLPTDNYINGFGWGTMYGDISE